MISTQELIVVFLVILLFFGASRLPALARSIGQACNEFKKAKDGVLSDIGDSAKKDESAAAAEKKDDGKKE